MFPRHTSHTVCATGMSKRSNVRGGWVGGVVENGIKLVIFLLTVNQFNVVYAVILIAYFILYTFTAISVTE